ncbi:multiubiquitin domain-containing protein [uncultured Enterovirga sp.]|uniref:multiubiquitin domain-containing protein n=1 Tax=uncultured Enterovirga sp. TaxID=2026352 RepID=UPI0035CAD0FA
MDHHPPDFDPDDDQPRSREAAYRIQLALDSVDFRPHAVNDPIPLGRQILAAGGLKPPEAFSLYTILPSGDFEDVRPDEKVDLRAKGAERFIAFSTDRLFRAMLNEHSIVWGVAAIPEHALRVLSGISSDEAVYLEVRGGTDQLIPEGGNADLGGQGAEAFITAPKPKLYAFFVNGVRYESRQRNLTGLQIKARVTNWDPNHDLVLEGHGHDPDRVIADDESVDLDTEHGPRRFSSVPKANFG